MATLSLPIDSWTEATVQQLVADQQAESLTVEFKRDLPITTPAEKREIAKDISALTNSAGGWIIYGIDERPGPNNLKVAGAVTPIMAPTDAAQRIDDIIAGSVTPRPRFRVRSVPAAAGGFFVVVHAFASSDDLHMVTDNRYYRRSETGARPMTETEVRQAYGQINRRQADANSFVRKVLESELAGRPEFDFLIALIPHTFREVIDPTHFQGTDPALAVIHQAYRPHLAPFELGIQVDLGAPHRLRIRREGSLTVSFPGQHEGGWKAGEVLLETAGLVALARHLWPRHGIVQPATLTLRATLHAPLQALPRDHFPRPHPPTLQGTQTLDLPVSQGDLLDAPLTIVRTLMDRLYQAMGVRRCPFFADDGTLQPDIARDMRDVLGALAG